MTATMKMFFLIYGIVIVYLLFLYMAGKANNVNEEIDIFRSNLYEMVDDIYGSDNYDEITVEDSKDDDNICYVTVTKNGAIIGCTKFSFDEIMNY